MPNKFIFEDFPVYKRVLEFNSEIATFLEEITGQGNYTIKDQLSRASMSILLNIAEGSGRFTKADKKNFYVNARGSTYECAACLQLFKGKKLIGDHKYDQLYNILNDIAKQLSALIKTQQTSISQN